MAIAKSTRIKYETVYRPAYEDFMKVYPFALEDLSGEQWKPVPNYEDYHVSSFGRIKSFKRNSEKILRPFLGHGGYLMIDLFKGGNVKKFLVSRLVAELFVPNLNNLPQVDHRYGIKFDNSAENLRWVTGAENQRFAVELGLKKSGEDDRLAKLSTAQVVYIRENPDRLTQKQLAEKFGVCNSTLRNIQRGECYCKTGGTVRKAFTHPHERTTEDICSKIRAEYKFGVRGFGAWSLAKKYGISKATVFRIIHEQGRTQN